MNDLMVDIETYGVTIDSAVRSIGACFFNIDTNEIGERFYANIDHDSCLALNLYVDPQTKAWWSNQTKEAQEALTTETRPIKEVIENFRRWIVTNTPDKLELRVWSNGVTFDLPILAFVQAQLRLKPAWNYWMERDTRTLKWLASAKADVDVPFTGTVHNALDDAIHQAQEMQACHRVLFPFGRPSRETEEAGA